MRWFVVFVLAAGCAAPTPDERRSQAAPGSASSTTTTPTEPIVITERSQLDAAVGRRVTIIGIQTRTKAPTVVGVDVDGDYDLSDKRVRVSGILHRRVVEPTEPDPDELPVASRGPGTYYSVVDPKTDTLAKPVLDE